MEGDLELVSFFCLFLVAAAKFLVVQCAKFRLLARILELFLPAPCHKQQIAPLNANDNIAYQSCSLNCSSQGGKTMQKKL